MATGDTLQQRGGSLGFALESTPGTAEAAPLYFVTCEDANITKEPVAFERVNNIGAERIGVQQSGHDVSWEISNAEIGPTELGMLCWLMLGDETIITNTHTIRPQFSSRPFTLFLDHGGPINASVQTQRAVGCRFDSMSIEINPREYAKVSASGMALSDNPLASGLTPTLDLSEDNAPLSWASFGSLIVTVAGQTPAVVNYPRSLSLNVQRSIERSAIARQTSETREILEGSRTVDLSLVLDLVESDTLTGHLYDAVEAGTDVGLSASFVIGSSSFSFAVNSARIMNDPFGPIGSGDGAQEVTLELQAFQGDSGDNVMKFEMNDGDSTAFDAR